MDGQSQRVENVFKLFLPELLTTDELTGILRERGVPDKLLTQDKAGLVSLFKRVAYPLPQRDFLPNYRGKLIMKLRKKADRRKISESFASDTKSFMIATSTDSKISTESSMEKLVSDRLKPPPDMNCDKKRIRLKSSSSSADLDNINIIIKRRKSSKTANDCQSSKLGKSNTEEHLNKEDFNKDNLNGEKKLTVPVPKKISLKRNFPSTVSSGKPVENTKTLTQSEPEKKHQLITWP